jgi:hypothetical protein
MTPQPDILESWSAGDKDASMLAQATPAPRLFYGWMVLIACFLTPAHHATRV